MKIATTISTIAKMQNWELGEDLMTLHSPLVTKGWFSQAHKHKHKHKHNKSISKWEHPRHKHKHKQKNERTYLFYAVLTRA